MKTKTFENGLVVEHRKSAVILKNATGKKAEEDDFEYIFTPEGFVQFVNYIEEAANEAWVGIVPREAYSVGSDYYEYYDRKYDNNGYLTIIENGISIEAPWGSLDTLYQFNKSKMQSFIYDLRKKLS